MRKDLLKTFAGGNPTGEATSHAASDKAGPTTAIAGGSSKPANSRRSSKTESPRSRTLRELRDFGMQLEDIPRFLQRAPEAPSVRAVAGAQNKLIEIGALRVIKVPLGEIECGETGGDEGRTGPISSTSGEDRLDSTCSPKNAHRMLLTPLGFHLAHLPVEPQVGKLLVYGHILGVGDVALTVAACLAGKSPFLRPDWAAGWGQSGTSKGASKGGGKDNPGTKAIADAIVSDRETHLHKNSGSDHLAVHEAFLEWKQIGQSFDNAPFAGTAQTSSDYWRSHQKRVEYCNRFALSNAAMEQIDKLRDGFSKQLRGIGFSENYNSGGFESSGASSTANSAPSSSPSSSSSVMARCALTAGLYPNIAQIQQVKIKKGGGKKGDGKKKGGKRGGKNNSSNTMIFGGHVSVQTMVVPFKKVEVNAGVGGNSNANGNVNQNANPTSTGSSFSTSTPDAITKTLIHPSSFNHNTIHREENNLGVSAHTTANTAKNSSAALDKASLRPNWVLYHKRMKTTQIYIFDTTLITDMVLLLFGGSSSPKLVVRDAASGGSARHDDGKKVKSQKSSQRRVIDTTLILDGKISFRCPDLDTVVLIKLLRQELDDLLVEKIVGGLGARGRNSNYNIDSGDCGECKTGGVDGIKSIKSGGKSGGGSSGSRASCSSNGRLLRNSATSSESSGASSSGSSGASSSGSSGASFSGQPLVRALECLLKSTLDEDVLSSEDEDGAGGGGVTWTR